MTRSKNLGSETITDTTTTVLHFPQLQRFFAISRNYLLLKNKTCSVLLLSSAVIFFICNTLRVSYLFSGQKKLTFSSGAVSKKEQGDEHALQLYMHNQRSALLNASSVIDLGLNYQRVPSRFIQEYFGGELEVVVDSWKKKNVSERIAYSSAFADPTRGDLLTGGLCNTIQVFREAKGVRRHVLFAHLNENWGAFSNPVPNRTVDWGEWDSHFANAGCTKDNLWWYLNHTNVSAIFTVTHQWLEHPKIISLPLGTAAGVTISKLLQERPTPNRTELLLISNGNKLGRGAIVERVIANFNGTIKNTYQKGGSDYWQNLRRSKFILCPSGLGWDTYRAWEALCMGAIPVLETYYRQDGFYKTFDDLPVLWVDHFNNVTPALLEEAYPKILSKAQEYNFAKLTKQWW
eukprot:CAMPEP_0196130840 /NCGR_PEP_ID=MMETSP0910-20130528/1077_1 /TAXON_ID=49265 /ORGANISM="Thalassiosira rotula, Strain GSO102" /LENGTH=403 /DNA_ID=CAMNT_0041390221 /DNA_START=3 /DNA_END=1211 /DNA_ORIENTATION=+